MLVTIFGGGGFLGRNVAQELLAQGMRVRVAERDPAHALRVKPLGNLGQTQLVHADVRDAASVERAVAGSDAVVNLVAVLKGDLDGVNHKGAANVRAYLARLAQTFPGSRRIWLTGTSAGGYGVQLNYHRFAAAFESTGAFRRSRYFSPLG